MKRRFVIGVEGMTKGEELKFRAFLGGSWWHWISNFWLYVTDDADIDVASIRDKILKINSNVRVLVLEFPEDISWAGFGAKNSAGKDMFRWLKDTWGSS